MNPHCHWLNSCTQHESAEKIKLGSCFPTVKAHLMTWYRHSFLSHALRVTHYARCAVLTVTRFQLHSERSAWHLVPFNLQVTCLHCGRTLQAVYKQCDKIFELQFWSSIQIFKIECVNFIFVMWVLLFFQLSDVRETIRIHPGRRTTTVLHTCKFMVGTSCIYCFSSRNMLILSNLYR